jgi:hypothetical protein
VCLAAHEEEFRRWASTLYSPGYSRNCRTSTASPAEPGDLPWLLAVNCDAEPEAIRREAAMVVAPVRRPAPEGVHVPGAPAEAAARLAVGPIEPGTAIVRSAGVVCVPHVRAPLPDVSEHVVQTPRVRPLQSYRPGAVAVFVKPGEVAQGLTDVCRHVSAVEERAPGAEKELSRRPGPADVFPFRFRPEAAACRSIKSSRFIEFKATVRYPNPPCMLIAL